MEITLLRADISDAKALHTMQIKAFKNLLEKYQDFDTSPANEGVEKVFVLPEFQGKGIAQEAIRLCEKIHGNENRELDTILQEPKNCHLYEKLGYRQTGKTEVINERLTLVFYEKAEC